MKSWSWILFATLVFGCSHHQASPTSSNPETKKEAENAKPTPAIHEELQLVEGVSCGHGNDHRRLEVFPKEKGCSLHYSKFGQSKEIAMAIHGVQYCRDKLRNVRQHLEQSGFVCE